MKKFACILIGLSFIAFTGCPKPATPPANAGKKTVVTPTATASSVLPETPEVKPEPKEELPPEEKPQSEVNPEPLKEEPKTAEKSYKEKNIDIVKAYQAKRKFDVKNKPKAPIVLPKEYITPDGMAVNPKTGTLFLSVPNFGRRPGNTGAKLFSAVLAKVDVETGKVETVLELEKIDNIKVPTNQIGPMGIAFGPDGHIYLCDNQYFFDTANKSRILRILMDGDKPTGKVEIVVDGTKLSNAVMWLGDNLYLTDTFFDIEGKFGTGGVWQFKKDEVLKAGTEANPPIKVAPIKKGLGDDPHLIAFHEVQKIDGGGNGAPDGITADSAGVIYYGFFGTGEMHRIVLDKDAKVASNDVIHKAGDYFHCCDGIYYDKGTDKVYINDSAANAIHAFTPPKDTKAPVVFETIWENGDTDGADGSLDQPCECVVIGKKMIIVNFDWPFDELLNTKSDDPSTLSVIELP